MNTKTPLQLEPETGAVKIATVQNASQGRMFSKTTIILGAVGIVALAGASGYYLGSQSDLDTSSDKPVIAVSKETKDVQATDVVSTDDAFPDDIVIIEDQPTPFPGAANMKIVVPANWEEFSATDPDYGVQTTLSMPPGFSFRFSGSEFTIQNDSDATELWEYSTSIYRNNENVLKNHYDGSSRRVWYKKYLDERQSVATIIGAKERSLNSSTFLEITVQTPSYNDRGETSGAKSEAHYVYVKDNVVHIISPASIKAATPEAQLSEFITIIMVSLKSKLL
jgi:hypothetical protein